MPQVLPALGSIALNAAIGIGASIASSVLGSLFSPQKQTQGMATSRGLRFEMTVGESVAVSAIWGRGRTGGQLTFAQEYGDNNEWVKFKFDCGRGWYDSLVGASADEKKLTFSGSNGDVHGRVVEEFRDAGGTPRMWMKWYSGAPGQAADAGLIAAAPTRWGSSHTATATPYVIVTLNYEPDMFTGGSLPTFGFDWRGLRLYDWRKDSTVPGGAGAHRWDNQATWEWTDNPAVMAWNWRRGYWRNGVKLFGMGFSRYANDLAYFTAAANLADEELYFEETDTTLPRYAFGREIGDDEEHLAVLRQFEESWCGSSFDRGGAYAPVPAAAVLPVLTLEDYHRVDGAPVSADRWGRVSAKKTKIHGSYAPVADLFIPTPYAARINLDLEALTRGPKAVKFDQLYEHTAERAQMRAEIELRRFVFGATRTETFGPIANVLEPGDAVTRNCEWGPTLMIVEGVEPGPDGIGKVVSFSGWSNTIVPDPDEGFLDLPADQGTLPTAASRILQVPGFDIDPLQRVTGGNEEPFGRATWSPIEDPNCDQVIIRCWPTAIPSEVEEFAADARLATAKIVGPLRPLTNYTTVALLTRHDLRRTYPTDPKTFTTGAFVAGAVGGETINIENLRAEVLAAVQSILLPTPMSIQAQMDELRDDFEAFAARVWDITTVSDRRTTTLQAKLNTAQAEITEDRFVVASDREAAAMRLDVTKAEFNTSIAGVTSLVSTVASDLAAEALARIAMGAQLGANLAALDVTYKAIVGPSGSLTSAVTNLAASFNGFTLNGAVGFQLMATPAGGSARYAITIKAGGNVVNAFYLDAVADGLGGYKGRAAVFGDEFYLLNPDGSYAASPLYVIGGVVRARFLRFEKLTSLDETTIVLDGVAPGFFSLGAP